MHTLQYEYTPYVWPILAASAIMGMLATYAWRHRYVPGAAPFAVAWWFTVPWAVGNALVLAATDIPTKIFWIKFQSIWPLPAVTAILCFALEYADLGVNLNRRTLSLFAVLPFLVFLLVLTNDAHHLVWVGFTSEGHLLPQYGTAGWIIIYYGISIQLITSGIFIWLFVRSPLHRRAVILCLCGQIVVRISAVFGHSNRNPIEPINPMVIGAAVAAVMYALALFRFRMFDPVPIARRTVIDQMREGMLVLDDKQRIVDLNPAAKRILGMGSMQTEGAALAEVFPVGSTTEPEVTVSVGGTVRRLALRRSPLKTSRNLTLGSLVLLYDTTEERQAQTRLLEQEKALATLRERDRVARELHDSLGQVLGFAKMQAQAAQGFLSRGLRPETDECLARLVAVAQDAHSDVREYIIGARAGTSSNGGFLTALEDYLRRFRESCDLAVRLNVAPGLTDDAFQPLSWVQLLRIIQEGLTNVRKHARATGVDIRITVRGGRVEASIEDDGFGFDPALVETTPGQSFGLRFMRERAEEVKGIIHVDSAPGAGTRVVISLPLNEEPL